MELVYSDGTVVDLIAAIDQAMPVLASCNGSLAPAKAKALRDIKLRCQHLGNQARFTLQERSVAQQHTVLLEVSDWITMFERHRNILGLQDDL